MADPQTVHATVVASRALLGIVARSVAPALEQVSLPQLRVLVVLSGAGPLRTGVLAERTGVHPSTLTRTADRLVGAGYVRRLDNPGNRREVLIELTERGRTLVQDGVERRREALGQVLERLPDGQAGEVLAAFEAFALAAGETSNDDLARLGI